MKRTTLRWIAVATFVAGAMLLVHGTASANQNYPGTCHGHNRTTCRPDPQPSHGQDCRTHGRRGGPNQDHCGPAATPTPTPSKTGDPTPTPSTTVGGVHRGEGLGGGENLPVALAKTGGPVEVPLALGLLCLGTGLALVTARRVTR